MQEELPDPLNLQNTGYILSIGSSSLFSTELLSSCLESSLTRG